MSERLHRRSANLLRQVRVLGAAGVAAAATWLPAPARAQALPDHAPAPPATPARLGPPPGVAYRLELQRRTRQLDHWLHQGTKGPGEHIDGNVIVHWKDSSRGREGHTAQPISETMNGTTQYWRTHQTSHGIVALPIPRVDYICATDSAYALGPAGRPGQQVNGQANGVLSHAVHVVRDPNSPAHEPAARVRLERLGSVLGHEVYIPIGATDYTPLPQNPDQAVC